MIFMQLDEVTSRSAKFESKITIEIRLISYYFSQFSIDVRYSLVFSPEVTIAAARTVMIMKIGVLANDDGAHVYWK